MRYILSLSFWILTHMTFGQTQLDSLLQNPDYFIFNDSSDTLRLTPIYAGLHGPFNKSSFLEDSIQINGVGSKEVVFRRAYFGQTRDIKQASQTMERMFLNERRSNF